MVPNNDSWFYIRSVATGGVITVGQPDGASATLRSQVYVCPPERTDDELWQWDGQYLRNKATDLVLDIRKGRLRLIEDTDICIFSKKVEAAAHNQLWGVREGDESNNLLMIGSAGSNAGCFIYSQSNADWVLDVSIKKLILFPYQPVDNENQRWEFVPIDEDPKSQSARLLRVKEHQQQHVNPGKSGAAPPETFPAPPSSPDLFIRGLTPAKRGSQASISSTGSRLSLTAYKEAHQVVYLERNPRLSNKTMAMAAAYQTWQTWKIEQVSLLTAQPSEYYDQAVDQPDVETKTRARLQTMARTAANNIFDGSDQLDNHKEQVMDLAGQLVTQLYEQLPASP